MDSQVCFIEPSSPVFGLHFLILLRGKDDSWAPVLPSFHLQVQWTRVRLLAKTLSKSPMYLIGLESCTHPWTRADVRRMLRDNDSLLWPRYAVSMSWNGTSGRCVPAKGSWGETVRKKRVPRIINTAFYTYTHMQAHMHAYTHAHMHTWTHSCMCSGLTARKYEVYSPQTYRRSLSNTGVWWLPTSDILMNLFTALLSHMEKLLSWSDGNSITLYLRLLEGLCKYT